MNLATRIDNNRTKHDIVQDANLLELPQRLGLDEDEYRPRLFPFVLHDMLEDVHRNGMEHIVSWCPKREVDVHGLCDSFRVHDIEKFEQMILPRYFKTQRYKSFQRNLNIHNFLHVKGRQYAHPCFIRGNRKACQLIHRPRKNVLGYANRESTAALQDFLPHFNANCCSPSGELHTATIGEMKNEPFKERTESIPWMQHHSIELLALAKQVVSEWQKRES